MAMGTLKFMGTATSVATHPRILKAQGFTDLMYGGGSSMVELNFDDLWVLDIH